MATLYDLETRYMDLEELLSDPDADQEQIEIQLELAGDDIVDKAEGYLKIRQDLLGSVETLKREIERLEKKKKTVENNAERLKRKVLEALEIAGKKKVVTDLFTATIKDTPPHLVIDDEEEIPFEFYNPQEPKLDKTRLLKALKESDEAFEYAHLEKGKTLLIK